MVVLTPYREYNRPTKIPKHVITKNRNYLYGRYGKKFIDKNAKLDKCIITDFSDSSLVFNNDWLQHADRRVKYAFQYHFVVQGDMNYYFTTVYDSLGNRLSEHMLPNQKQNEHFDKILSVCEAVKVTERDTSFTSKVWLISLDYSDSLNAFIWEVGHWASTPDRRITIQKKTFIHANTGEIIKREEQEEFSSCEPPRMPDLHRK